MTRTTRDDPLTWAVTDWVEMMVGWFLDPLGFVCETRSSGDCRSPVFCVSTTSTSRRSLALQDNLAPTIGLPDHPGEDIPKAAVRFEPPSLGPNETAFRMVVDAEAVRDHAGGTYWGYVTAGDSDGAGAGGPGIFASTDGTSVWIVIP